MAEEWLLADSNVPNDWGTPENAYDDDTDTYAAKGAGQKSWTPFIELHYDTPIQCSKLRIYYAVSYTTAGTLDIDAFVGGVWVGVYNSTHFVDGWRECNVGGEGLCTAIRARMYNGNSMFSNTYYLREFQAYGEPIQEGAEPYAFVM